MDDCAKGLLQTFLEVIYILSVFSKVAPACTALEILVAGYRVHLHLPECISYCYSTQRSGNSRVLCMSYILVFFSIRNHDI